MSKSKPLKKPSRKPAYARLEKIFVKNLGCNYFLNGMNEKDLEDYREKLVNQMKKRKKIKILDDDVPYDERRSKFQKMLLKKVGSKKMISEKDFSEKDFNSAMAGDCNFYGKKLFKKILKKFEKQHGYQPQNIFGDENFADFIVDNFSHHTYDIYRDLSYKLDSPKKKGFKKGKLIKTELFDISEGGKKKRKKRKNKGIKYQCKGKTKQGKRCKTKSYNRYCFRHK